LRQPPSQRRECSLLSRLVPSLSSLLLLASETHQTAAEDFLRWQFPESPRGKGWWSAARQLVEDAWRSLGEAKNAARLMDNAVLCEFFTTWMILTRA
jgi:hypothetical protein